MGITAATTQSYDRSSTVALTTSNTLRDHHLAVVKPATATVARLTPPEIPAFPLSYYMVSPDFHFLDNSPLQVPLTGSHVSPKSLAQGWSSEHVSPVCLAHTKPQGGQRLDLAVLPAGHTPASDSQAQVNEDVVDVEEGRSRSCPSGGEVTSTAGRADTTTDTSRHPNKDPCNDREYLRNPMPARRRWLGRDATTRMGFTALSCNGSRTGLGKYTRAGTTHTTTRDC